MRRITYIKSNVYSFALLLAITFLGLSGTALAGERASAHPTWPGPGQLFLGTCYQPIDRSPEQIDQDIAIMKRAGFNVVRMGDLSWDSFEPSKGKFTFEWFDRIMDKMQVADYVMDEASANALREYVRNGGTVLMTALSAKVDEHGLWFDTPLPGRLSDVFGLKTNAFYDSPPLTFDLDGRSIQTNVRRYEVLEPSSATVLARFVNTPDQSPAITINKFGKGNALYLATESTPSAIAPLLARLLQLSGIQEGPSTPDGVFARVIEGRTLYVNTTNEQKKIAIEGSKRGILTNRVYEGTVILGPLETDLVQ
jgi:beta-galactosidase GanA